MAAYLPDIFPPKTGEPNLCIEPTNNFKEERSIWLKVSRFFNDGGELGPIVPDFKPKGEETRNPASSPRLYMLNMRYHYKNYGKMKKKQP